MRLDAPLRGRSESVRVLEAEAHLLAKAALEGVEQFEMDVTEKSSGQRHQMAEVGLYTVRAGKVAQEEFLYLQG